MRRSAAVWLFLRFMGRRLLRTPLRPLLLVVAVFLATTLWSAVLRTTFSGVRAFEVSVGLSAERFPLQLAPVGGRMVLADLAGCLDAVAGKFDLLGVRREPAVAILPDGREIPVRVVGIGGYGAPSALFGPGVLADDHALVVGPAFVQDSGVSAESHLTVRLGSGVLLSGRMEPRSEVGELLGAHVVVVPLTTLSRIHAPAVVDAVLVRPLRTRTPGAVGAVTPERELIRLQSGLQEWVRGCVSTGAPIRVERTTARVERGEALLGAYRFNVFVMALMAVMVCALLIAQATHASLITVGRELVILRTLGVSAATCVWCVVGEALVLGVIGALAGVTLGYPVTMILADFLTGTASAIYAVDVEELEPLAFVLNQLVVVVSILGITALGSVSGGAQALWIAPMVGTRRGQQHVRPFNAGMVYRVAAAAAVLLALTILGLMLARSSALSYGAVGGCIAFVLGVTPLSMLVVARCSGRMPGLVVTRLAQGGVCMGARRYLLGALGVTLAVTLIVALTVMVHSFRATLRSWMQTRVQGDLFISPALEGEGNDARLSRAFMAQLTEHEGVARVVPYFEVASMLHGRPLLITGTDFGVQFAQRVYQVRAGATEQYRADAGGCHCLVSESAAKFFTLHPNDIVRIEDRLPCKVLAIIREFATEQPVFILDQETFKGLYPWHSPKSAVVYLKADEAGVPVRSDTLSVVRQQLQREAGAAVIIRDQGELKGLVVRLFEDTFRVTGSVRWIVFGIAILGVVVSSMQLLWERRREAKTFVVLGGGGAQVVAWFVLEGVLVSTGPVVLGTFGGIVMGWILTEFLTPAVFGWSLSFGVPLGAVLIPVGFLSSIAVVLGAGIAAFAPATVRVATLSDE